MNEKIVAISLAIILVLLVSGNYIVDFNKPKKVFMPKRETVLIARNSSSSEYKEFSRKMKEELAAQKITDVKSEIASEEQNENVVSQSENQEVNKVNNKPKPTTSTPATTENNSGTGTPTNGSDSNPIPEGSQQPSDGPVNTDEPSQETTPEEETSTNVQVDE